LVLGAGSPSGPRASSAVWLRLRSGCAGLVVVVCCAGSDATTGAIWVVVVCGWATVGVASGVERLAPAAVGRSVISIVLLVGICSSVAEAPATACVGCACTWGCADVALCSSVPDDTMAVLLLPLGCVVRSRAMPLASGAHTYAYGVCGPLAPLKSSLPGVVFLWLVKCFILAEDANGRATFPGIGDMDDERQV